MSTTHRVAGNPFRHPSAAPSTGVYMQPPWQAPLPPQKHRGRMIARIIGACVVAGLALVAVIIATGILRHQQTPEEFAVSHCKQSVAADLKDPGSAQFSNIDTSQYPNTITGEVNGKNSYGGYVGSSPFTCDIVNGVVVDSYIDAGTSG